MAKTPIKAVGVEAENQAPAKVSCSGTQKNGSACKMPVIKGTETCFNHLGAEGRLARGFQPAAAPKGPRWLTGSYEGVTVRIKGKAQTLNATFTLEDGQRVLTLV